MGLVVPASEAMTTAPGISFERVGGLAGLRLTLRIGRSGPGASRRCDQQRVSTSARRHALGKRRFICTQPSLAAFGMQLRLKLVAQERVQSRRRGDRPLSRATSEEPAANVYPVVGNR